MTLKAKGEKPEIENYPLHPLRDVRKKKGTLDEIIKEAQETEKDDYISITLTDEIDPYKPGRAAGTDIFPYTGDPGG